MARRTTISSKQESLTVAAALIGSCYMDFDLKFLNFNLIAKFSIYIRSLKILQFENKFKSPSILCKVKAFSVTTVFN